MEGLAEIILGSRNLMDIPLEIWGFTFSFWDVLLWSIVVGIVIFLLVRFFE